MPSWLAKRQLVRWVNLFPRCVDPKTCSYPTYEGLECDWTPQRDGKNWNCDRHSRNSSNLWPDKSSGQGSRGISIIALCFHDMVHQ